MATKKHHQNHAVMASSPNKNNNNENNNSQVIQVHKLVSNLIIFASGVALGIAINLYSKPFSKPSFNNVIQFNYQKTPQSPNATTFTEIPSPPPPKPRTGLREFLRPPSLSHDMTDDELLWRASVAPKAGLRGFPSEIAQKVAFLFLVRGDVFLAPFWDRFFKGYDGLFSVYVHSSPSFNASAVSPDSAFHGRWISSKDVNWGDPNMVKAERRLLANALLDLSNKRFVLLSEACIPLFNFSTVYDYLMGSKKTFVEAYDLPGPVGRGRYKSKMKPQIKLSQWRKGSQWFELDRALALEVVADRKYFKLFDKYCHKSCYSDEHYLPTFLSIKFWRRNSNRTLTWVDWSRGGPHPTRFVRQSVTVELLERLRHSSECKYNGKNTNICHLFARKFMPNTLDRLLKFAPKLMQFN